MNSEVNQPKHFEGQRIRGIPDNNEKDGRKRLDHDYAEVENVFKHLKVNYQITAQMTGNVSAEREKDWTLLMKLAYAREGDLLCSYFSSLKSFDRRAYVCKELSKEKILIENEFK